MKASRDDIIELIRQHADAPAPAADPAFVERLERRLRSIDLTPTKPGRKRIGRFTVSAIVAGTMIAGAAAAAGIVSWRNSSSQPPATSPREVVTTTRQAPVPSSLVIVPITSAETTLPPPPPTTARSTTPVIASTEVETTTTVAITTLPPPTTVETIVVTTSTEVRTPATLTLTCVPTTGGVSCSWDGGPDGTTHYALLRTDSGSTVGRVFTPEPGATTYLDTLVVAGTTYRYLVHALDAGEHSLAHSDGMSTPCCG